MNADCPSNWTNSNFSAARDDQIREAGVDSVCAAVESSAPNVGSVPLKNSIGDTEGHVDLVGGRVAQGAQDCVPGVEELSDRELITIEDTTDQIQWRGVIALDCSKGRGGGCRDRNIDKSDWGSSGLHALTTFKLVVSLGKNRGSSSWCAVGQEEELLEGQVVERATGKAFTETEGGREGASRRGGVGGDVPGEDSSRRRYEARRGSVRLEDWLKNNHGRRDRRTKGSIRSKSEDIALVDLPFYEGVCTRTDTGRER